MIALLLVSFLRIQTIAIIIAIVLRIQTTYAQYLFFSGKSMIALLLVSF